MRRMSAWTSTLIALLGLSPTQSEGQPASADTTRAEPAARRFCFRGRRLPMCQAFLLVEGGFYKPIHTTIRPIPPITDRSDVRRDIPGAFGNHLTWEIGAMANVARHSAVGATALLGAGGVDSFRKGIRARYRRWLNARTSAEVAAGPLWMTVAGAGGASGIGMTADLRVNFSDEFAVGSRVDRVNRPDFAAGHAVYVGASLVSKHAIVGTAIGFVLVIIGVAASTPST